MWAFYIDFLLWVLARHTDGPHASRIREAKASSFLTGFQFHYASKA
jgi:hypothetical protein